MTQIRVIETVSHADGSAGWNLMIGIETFGIISAGFHKCPSLIADPMTVMASSTAAVGRAETHPRGLARERPVAVRERRAQRADIRRDRAPVRERRAGRRAQPLCRRAGRTDRDRGHLARRRPARLGLPRRPPDRHRRARRARDLRHGRHALRVPAAAHPARHAPRLQQGRRRPRHRARWNRRLRRGRHREAPPLLRPQDPRTPVRAARRGERRSAPARRAGLGVRHRGDRLGPGRGRRGSADPRPGVAADRLLGCGPHRCRRRGHRGRGRGHHGEQARTSAGTHRPGRARGAPALHRGAPSHRRRGGAFCSGSNRKA